MTKYRVSFTFEVEEGSASEAILKVLDHMANRNGGKENGVMLVGANIEEDGGE